MIMGEVRRYLRDNNSIRVSRSIKDTAYRILKLKDELTIKNGKEPTDDELAKILEIDNIELAVALDSLKQPVSLFEPIYNGLSLLIYKHLAKRVICVENVSRDYLIKKGVDVKKVYTVHNGISDITSLFILIGEK